MTKMIAPAMAIVVDLTCFATVYAATWLILPSGRKIAAEILEALRGGGRTGTQG